MVKKTLITLLSLLFIVIVPSSAYAHFDATDGAVNADMHIDPDDSPIPGQKSAIFFEFNDPKHTYTANNCLCTLTVTEQNQQIYSNSLFLLHPQTGPNTPSALIVFPKQDTYQVIIDGKPNVAGAFKSFHLTWNVRVDRPANTKPDEPTANPSMAMTASSFHPNIPPQALLILISFVVVLAIGGISYLTYRRKKLAPPQMPPQQPVQSPQPSLPSSTPQFIQQSQPPLQPPAQPMQPPVQQPLNPNDPNNVSPDNTVS